MCSEETNDNACCCCAPSYVGVIVFGVLGVIWFGLCGYGLIAPATTDWAGNELSEEQIAYNWQNSLFNTISSGIALIPFVLVLIWQKSTGPRLVLFITSVALLVINFVYNVIMIIGLLGYADLVAE